MVIPARTLDLPGIGDIIDALTHPVRAAIVERIAGKGDVYCSPFDGEISTTDLAEHLRVLRDAGIIDSSTVGTHRVHTLRRYDLERAYPGVLDNFIRSTQQPGKAT